MLIGHSGAKLQLILKKDGYLVEKSGSARLLVQMKKQERYERFIQQNKILNLCFQVPKIINYDENKCKFTMEFINGASILDIFEKSDISYLNYILERLLKFIQLEISNGTYQIFPYQSFLKKINQIQDQIPFLDSCYFIRYKEILKKYQRVKIPVGYCHGDLTFSNLIFTDKICLIDFCDNFVESPLQDIAKLLQETRLKWSYLIAPQGDKVKIEIGYDYFNQQLQKTLFTSSFSCPENIFIFYLMVLFRILPYAKQEHIKQKILNEISLLLKYERIPE